MYCIMHLFTAALAFGGVISDQVGNEASIPTHKRRLRGSSYRIYPPDPADLPKPECHFSVMPQAIGSAITWILCPGCIVDLWEQTSPTSKVELDGNLKNGDALKIAYASGFDLFWSEVIPNHGTLEDSDETNVNWYGINLGLDEYPITKSSSFNNESITCTDQYRDSELWLRYDEKLEGHIFLPSENRQELISRQLQDNMETCYSNLVNAKSDSEWEAFFEGTAEDAQHKFEVDLVKNLLVYPLLLVPEVEVSAELLFNAYTACGNLCRGALDIVNDYTNNKDKLHNALTGLTSFAVDQASQQESQAQSEVESAIKAGDLLLQRAADIKKKLLQDYSPKMTNQEIYLLVAKYKYDSPTSGPNHTHPPNCTVPGTETIVNTFIEQVTFMMHFEAKEGHGGHPTTHWGDYKGICKEDGKKQWEYYSFGYSQSGSDCHSRTNGKNGDVHPDFEDLALQIASTTFGPCLDGDNPVCRY